MESSNNYVDLSAPATTAEFDAAEHPLELELNWGEGEEQGEEDEHDNSGELSQEEGEAALSGEEAEYEFRFQGEMDPFSFAEDDDSSGLQPYQRFEQCEVLAAKKRSAPFPPESSLNLAKKLRLEEDDNLQASFQEIMETMNLGRRRNSRKNVIKRRGRRKGSKSRANPEVIRKLGDANIHYAFRRFDEAICLLNDVIRLAPNLCDPYHRLGLIYNAMGDKKRSLNFYMIAAHLTPKDASLWNLLSTMSKEQGDIKQANYCLGKAITADPKDIVPRSERASLYVELGEYQKAAEEYEQISHLCPDDMEVLRKATELFKRCGLHERAVCFLEGYLRHQKNNSNLSIVDTLASVLMESNEHAKALRHIEHAEKVYCAGEQIPLCLIIKAGICHVHLGDVKKAEDFFKVLPLENAYDLHHLIIDVADALMAVEQYESAMKYYMVLDTEGNRNNGSLHLKMARCSIFLAKAAQAIEYYSKAIQELDDSVDARLKLSSLLIEEAIQELDDSVDARLKLSSLLIAEGRDDEAISILSPPAESESEARKLWSRNGKIKLKLSQIYKAKGSYEAFVTIIYPAVRETLSLEIEQQKIKARRRLSRTVLSERAKVLDDHQTDSVFQGFRPVASSADLSKAARAKKLLQKKNVVKEKERAAALAAGIDWKSDDSDDESPQVFKEPPLPDLLKDKGLHHLIVDLCKSLSSLERYSDALEVINLSLKLSSNILSVQIKEDLQTLGAQIACHIADPAQGWDCVRHIVSEHPYSLFAWNCYYEFILMDSCRLIRKRNNQSGKHNKFLHNMKIKYKDSVPPILISAHQFAMIGQHQAAAREYLEAYKLMPGDPLINLCVGSALMNLALGHRLPNKHQAILQGFAFLYSYSQLCEFSQESLYNIARAYHHIGLVSLAAPYYEKVLAVYQKDYPIPSLPNESPPLVRTTKKPICSNLRREAAYNLHLIYKKSGAFDLARQVLKDHVVL